MNKDTLIKVTNRATKGRVGYKLPELNVRRQFSPRETKEIPFKELEALSFSPGGLPLLKDYLVVRNEEAIKALGIEVEPEYFYSEEDVKRILTEGSYEEFLDCLDFAPDGVIELIKSFSVSLTLNDMAKRNAILDKTGFNVTSAIDVANSKYDGDAEEEAEAAPKTRRVQPSTQSS